MDVGMVRAVRRQRSRDPAAACTGRWSSTALDLGVRRTSPAANASVRAGWPGLDRSHGRPDRRAPRRNPRRSSRRVGRRWGSRRTTGRPSRSTPGIGPARTARGRVGFVVGHLLRGDGQRQRRAQWFHERRGPCIGRDHDFVACTSTPSARSDAHVIAVRFDARGLRCCRAAPRHGQPRGVAAAAP